MVDKDFAQRQEELRLALESMALSLNEIQNPDKLNSREIHVHNLQPQLRQLIADGGANFRPRLLHIAAETNALLEFYAVREGGLAFTWEVVIPHQKRSYFSPTGYAPNFIFQKCWSPKPKSGFHGTTLIDWMQTTLYRDGQREYTRNKLLRAITDKDGGGHLDDKQDFLAFTLQQRFLSFDNDDPELALTGKDLFLIDLAALTTWLGKRMLLVLECREKGMEENECEEINLLDVEFDRFQAQNSTKFGWIIPRADSWGQGRIPPSGQALGRLRISREDEWWKKDYVYTNVEGGIKEGLKAD